MSWLHIRRCQPSNQNQHRACDALSSTAIVAVCSSKCSPESCFVTAWLAANLHMVSNCFEHFALYKTDVNSSPSWCYAGSVFSIRTLCTAPSWQMPFQSFNAHQSSRYHRATMRRSFSLSSRRLRECRASATIRLRRGQKLTAGSRWFAPTRWGCSLPLDRLRWTARRALRSCARC